MSSYFARTPGAYPRWFAHRGGASEHPENTLLAFEHAVGLGYGYLELDVHLTQDQHWVVLHDPALGRTTSGSGNVANYRLEELKSLDAGYHFAPERGCRWRGRGLTIPTLDELVSRYPRACLNVDIKANPVSWRRHGANGLARLFWQYVSDRGLEGQLLVATSSLSLANHTRRVSHGRAFTSASKPEAWAFVLHVRLGLPLLRPRYRALQVPPEYGVLRIVTPRFVERAHAAGVEVHVWTLNDPAEANLYLNMGVDGIMTDCPSAMLPLKQPIAPREK